MLFKEKVREYVCISKLHYSILLVYNRLSEIGRDLVSPGPTFLLKQGHPEQIAQDHIQMTFENLQDGDSSASLGSLYQCLLTLTISRWLMAVPAVTLQGPTWNRVQ